MFEKEGHIDDEIMRRENAELKVVDALKRYARNENLSKKFRMIVSGIPTLMYGSETWIWDERHIKCLSAGGDEIFERYSWSDKM